MSANNGGPAFPTVQTETVGSNGEYVERLYSYGGMALRDYFAAGYEPDISKITGNAARSLGLPHPTSTCEYQLAKWRAAMRAKLRYMEADAMLAEREKGGAK